MRSLFRTFSLVLICLLLIASSDAAINIYGHRVRRSIVVAQSSGVVNVNPGTNQTPDPGQGGEAVSSQTNPGHGSGTSSGVRATEGTSSKNNTQSSESLSC